jgi:hypothetical protein
MKKALTGLVAFMATSVALFASMQDREFSCTVVGAGTNAVTYVLRGELEAIKVDVTAPSTSTVTVASDQLTLFSKASIAADATFLPRAAIQTTAGVAATFVGGTNNAANAWYDKQPMAGSVTVTLVGENAASVTNNTKVTLIYKQ